MPNLDLKFAHLQKFSRFQPTSAISQGIDSLAGWWGDEMMGWWRTGGVME